MSLEREASFLVTDKTNRVQGGAAHATGLSRQLGKGNGIWLIFEVDRDKKLIDAAQEKQNLATNYLSGNGLNEFCWNRRK